MTDDELTDERKGDQGFREGSLRGFCESIEPDQTRRDVAVDANAA